MAGISKKKKYVPRDFEKDGKSNLSATLYASMLQSKAFKDLSPSAKVLYIYMKLQLFGQPAVDDDETIFYFNRALYMSVYKLYTKYEQFKRDRDLLMQHGLIEEVENGKVTRTKNKYRFSDKWKQWK